MLEALARLVGWLVEFAREVDRGIAVGYGHERPERNARFRSPDHRTWMRMNRRRCRMARKFRR